VGWYDIGSSTYGFVLKKGKYYSLGFPGARFTGATGINNAGQIVGGYTDDFTVWHGFVTDPIVDADLP
jgi:probable HAF family extracellular repeat protein